MLALVGGEHQLRVYLRLASHALPVSVSYRPDRHLNTGLAERVIQRPGELAWLRSRALRLPVQLPR